MNTLDIKQVLYAVCKDKFDPPLAKGDISFLVDSVLDVLATAMTSTNRVTLRNFGTFKRVIRKGRVFKVVGKETIVQDRPTITFKPGVGLKKLLKMPQTVRKNPVSVNQNKASTVS